MTRPVIRLVVKYDRLAFPHGDNDFDVEPPKYDDVDTPSLLTRLYDAGDYDTIPWSLPPAQAERERALKNLAHALFDERECNKFFPADAVIELPDGSAFEFLLIVRESPDEG